jgi:hypothetical protein
MVGQAISLEKGNYMPGSVAHKITRYPGPTLRKIYYRSSELFSQFTKVTGL